MANRDEAAVIDFLGNCWNSTFSIGNTATASVSASVTPAIKGRAHLTQLGWSVKNLSGSNSVTAVLEVRDASVAGTLLASWEIIVAAGTTQQDCYVLNIQGLRGKSLNMAFDVVRANLYTKVSAAGWIDSLGDG